MHTFRLFSQSFLVASLLVGSASAMDGRKAGVSTFAVDGQKIQIERL